MCLDHGIGMSRFLAIVSAPGGRSTINLPWGEGLTEGQYYIFVFQDQFSCKIQIKIRT